MVKMDDFDKLFISLTGKKISVMPSDYKSGREIDESAFEIISRLFFENRKAFYCLKNAAIKILKGKKDVFLFSAASYFCYVDCEFMEAKEYLKKAIEIDPRNLGHWIYLAFCFRQLGEEEKFNELIMNYDSIITEFINQKKDIDGIISTKPADNARFGE